MDLIERAAERLKKSERAEAEAKAPTKGKASPKKRPPRVKAAAPRKKIAPAVVQTSRQSRRVEIDLDHLRRNGFLVPDDPPTRLAEEFRVIKRQLLRRALPGGPDAIENGNMLLVTSTQPAEGKTFCAINLALSIASERDLTVLLVDADVARPQLMEALHVDADKGLIDVIVDERVSFPIACCAQTSKICRCFRLVGRIRPLPSCCRAKRWAKWWTNSPSAIRTES